MHGELSEECKQKLREIDGDLAGVRDSLLVMRETRGWNLRDRAVLAGYAAAIDVSIAVMNTVDEPCREVLRSIDQSAASLTARLRTLPPGDSFDDQVAAQELLQHVEDLQFNIQSMFYEAL